MGRRPRGRGSLPRLPWDQVKAYPANALKVTGTASGRVVQTLTFDEPLGGRQFVLSFSAKSSPAGSAIQNVQLEADGSTPICVINASVTTTMTRFSASGVWPITVQAKEMRVVLRMAATTAVTVYYDRVQVEERNHLTRWDAKTMLRYEHDLVPFKLQGDVVVLGFSDIAGVSRVKVDNTTWFEVTLSLNEGRAKALCGWEPRGGVAATGRKLLIGPEPLSTAMAGHRPGS